MSGKKVAILATSADKMGDHATGAWSEEITGSYYAFVDAGCTVTIYFYTHEKGVRGKGLGGGGVRGVISATRRRVTPKPTPVSNRRGAKPLCGAVHSSNSVYCVCQTNVKPYAQQLL